jgi:hypothetical protein
MNMMNNNIDDIIPKLKFISRLNKGDKINVKNMYIQPNNFINWIRRSFINIDDRSNTLMFVHNTVKRGFELLLQHIDSTNPFDTILCQNLYNDLRNTKTGFLNLRETYIDDVMFTCKIDALVEETDAKLTELISKYKILQTHTPPPTNPYGSGIAGFSSINDAALRDDTEEETREVKPDHSNKNEKNKKK